MSPIVIGPHSNIQDGVVIHSKSGAGVQIGSHTSIAHRAIVHALVILLHEYLLVLIAFYLIAKLGKTVLFAITLLLMV